jgi:hypothetical protein
LYTHRGLLAPNRKKVVTDHAQPVNRKGVTGYALIQRLRLVVRLGQGDAKQLIALVVDLDADDFGQVVGVHDVGIVRHIVAGCGAAAVKVAVALGVNHAAGRLHGHLEQAVVNGVGDARGGFDLRQRGVAVGNGHVSPKCLRR